MRKNRQLARVACRSYVRKLECQELMARRWWFVKIVSISMARMPEIPG